MLLVQQSTIARLAKAARPEAGAPPFECWQPRFFFVFAWKSARLHGFAWYCACARFGPPLCPLSCSRAHVFWPSVGFCRARFFFRFFAQCTLVLFGRLSSYPFLFNRRALGGESRRREGGACGRAAGRRRVAPGAIASKTGFVDADDILCRECARLQNDC